MLPIFVQNIKCVPVSFQLNIETSPSLDLFFNLDHDAYIDECEIELETRIGVGSFGEVFKGVWRGTDVAVKRIMETDITKESLKVGVRKGIK